MASRRPTLGDPDPVAPGVLASCVLLTLLTAVIAIAAHDPDVERPLRVLYFAVLFSAFQATGRRHREARATPFRLIEAGLLLLTLSQAAATTLQALLDDGSPGTAALAVALERGPVFLVGLVLVTFGLIVWVPTLVESQRVLDARWRRTEGQLELSEQARSRMEQRIVEADRLHAVGELAAGVAHDLRNPLAIVKAAADSMRRKARSPEELAEHTEVICRNIDRAERTIAALLDLGKPREMELRPVAVDALLADVTALVTVEARRREITIDRAGDTGLHAIADRRLLTQAMLNLLLNALQVSPPGHRIRLRTQRSGVGAGVVVIAVEDRGQGLDAERRAKLFTPFFTTREGGTGLGLLSSRRIVEELGGRIGLFPRHAGGARAVVLLRLAPDRRSAASAPSVDSELVATVAPTREDR